MDLVSSTRAITWVVQGCVSPLRSQVTLPAGKGPHTRPACNTLWQTLQLRRGHSQLIRNRSCSFFSISSTLLDGPRNDNIGTADMAARAEPAHLPSSRLKNLVAAQELLGPIKRTSVPTREEAFGLEELLVLPWTTQDAGTLLANKDIQLETCTSLIRALGTRGLWEAARSVVLWMRGEGGYMHPNVFTYNALLATARRTHQFQQVDVIMAEMAADGVAPDLITFHTIINLRAHEGALSAALAVRPAMVAAGLQPTVGTVERLLRACVWASAGCRPPAARAALQLLKEVSVEALSGGRQRRWARMRSAVGALCVQAVAEWADEATADDAVALLARMDAAGVEPPRNSELKLVEELCRAPVRPRLAYLVLLRQWRRGRPPPVLAVNHVLSTLLRERQQGLVLPVLAQMQAHGPPLNEGTRTVVRRAFHALLHAALRKRMASWVQQLLTRMLALGLEPDALSWRLALMGCAAAASTEGTLQLLQWMVQRGHKPDVVAYGAVLSALEKRDELERAGEVWEHMQRVGVRPNAHAYTTMIMACGKRGEYSRALALVDSMERDGLELGRVTYNALMTVCAWSGEGQRALAWFNRMRASSIDPDAVSYAQVIDALANAGDWDGALDMYKRSLDAGFEASDTMKELVDNIQKSNWRPSKDALADGAHAEEERACQTYSNMDAPSL